LAEAGPVAHGTHLTSPALLPGIAAFSRMSAAAKACAYPALHTHALDNSTCDACGSLHLAAPTFSVHVSAAGCKDTSMPLL
jgi:hypothetical protein